MSLEYCRCRGYARLGADHLIGKLQLDNAVDQLKIFEAHAGALSALGSDKLVDAGAEVVQLEVLVRRCLAVVDFLRPLLERHLAAECLVDAKGDIEEAQAVDAEIVDGATFRLDRVA